MSTPRETRQSTEQDSESNCGLATDLLLKQYEVVSEHYKHEDSLRLARDQNFTVLLLALFSIVGLFGQGTQNTFEYRIWKTVLCLTGIALAFAWWRLTDAGTWYVHLRRRQAAVLEKQLGIVGPFQDEMNEVTKARQYRQRGLHGRSDPGFPHGKAMRWVCAVFAILWVVYCMSLWIEPMDSSPRVNSKAGADNARTQQRP
jgi:hypothetical protein